VALSAFVGFKPDIAAKEFFIENSVGESRDRGDNSNNFRKQGKGKKKEWIHVYTRVYMHVYIIYINYVEGRTKPPLA
jgi:hypothetical protein